ncbi:uncharacterized protein J4E88_009300 [Alternaria novae-zelandiae]|uniref:uncharacterized protein n=1 Tax=Alternaria novae-zelandiae TaxID=430562 RepID=UPI0020C23486|nr:uncharacterized protein J4E88_009300 [Alternaria novae-zelandiae]KAI4671266.1 hypothetical protein J4E88_009300 [Alternaria novae-zelandiae]
MSTDTHHVHRKHIEALKQYTRSLEVLQMDCSGWDLTNADVKVITSRNPHLREVLLHRALEVTDKGIVHILKNCPSISIIKVTGPEIATGLVTGKFAGFLNQPDIVDSRTNLEAIYLYDQGTDESMIKGISKKWRNLLISTGITMACGDVWSFNWLGGKCLKEGEETALEDMGYRLPKVDEDFTIHPWSLSFSRREPSRSVQAGANTSDIPEGDNSDKSETGSDGEEEEDGSEDDDENEENDEDGDGSAWASDDSEEEAYFHDIYTGRRSEPVYEPYEPAEVPLSDQLYYALKENWGILWPDDVKRTSIQKIHFTDDFCVTDMHIKAIATAPREFRKSLHTIYCDYGDVSDAAVAILTRAVPHLKDVDFCDTHTLTENAITSIVKNCPGIERIAISGDDRTPGKIKCRGLEDVLADLTLAKKLRHLELWDQDLDIKSVKKISKARPDMAIVSGKSVGDSMAAQIVAAQTGRGWRYVYLGGHLVDSGGGFAVEDFGYGDLGYEDIESWDKDFDSDGMDLDDYM